MLVEMTPKESGSDDVVSEQQGEGKEMEPHIPDTAKVTRDSVGLRCASY